ncbi:CHASE2 domain-containing protein [Romeria aff. gracilis LEGE 07310]|uniref:non-specific serine/threonine protein kinase n=1 Tax=Vasconcelosia minhoensis LEGE 07310 TaxID=915328 RepID=A0A8J7AX42_9CYAN|nr:serine/threonine-protein kinase [Romeria gracilis]MBE9077592.1 CHASE2 domain-containing protein [Romeria aff. gracilis LEGE 07310]
MDVPPNGETTPLTPEDKLAHYWRRNLLTRHWRLALLGFCISAAAAATGLNLGLVALWERQVQTLFFELRGPVSPPDDVVILAIDEESLAQGQHYLNDPQRYPQLQSIQAWPWQRQAYATAIEKLLRAGARAVALDVVFSAPSTYGEADDAALTQTLQTYGDRVVLAAEYGNIDIRQGELIQPLLPLLRFRETPVQIGAINFLVEPDGRIHRLSEAFLSALHQSEQRLTGAAPGPEIDSGPSSDRSILSFAQATLSAAKIEPPPDVGESIYFYGPGGTFTQIPFWYVLDPDPWQNQLDSGAFFKDKTVLIGTTATIHQDFHSAPFSQTLLYPQSMAGVEILANTVATAAAGRAIRPLIRLPWLNGIAVLLLGIGVIGLMQLSHKPWQRFSWAMASLVCWGLVGYGALVGGQVILMTATPMMGIVSMALVDLGSGFVAGQSRRKRFRSTLARYVTSPIVQEIISQQDDFQDLLVLRQADIIGTLLCDRYRILQVLGAGGFSETYLASDTQRPGAPTCVVKQLKIVSNNPQSHQMAQRLFRAEADTLERLGEHEQIPRLLAYFEVNYSFYLVQERVEGVLLRELLGQQSAMSQRAVTEMLIDLLPVIGFVHQQGVIHRDIKPSNIIRRTADGRFVLIDFGAVKQISNQLADTSARVTSTIGIGTQGYMPSEQSAGLPNFSSDLYALGITAIEALTGLPPHAIQRSSTGEIIWTYKVVGLSIELAAVINRMVRYDFNQRYRSTQEALTNLEQLNLATLPHNQAVFLGLTDPAAPDGASETSENLAPTEILPESWPEQYRSSHQSQS